MGFSLRAPSTRRRAKRDASVDISSDASVVACTLRSRTASRAPSCVNWLEHSGSNLTEPRLGGRHHLIGLLLYDGKQATLVLSAHAAGTMHKA